MPTPISASACTPIFTGCSTGIKNRLPHSLFLQITEQKGIENGKAEVIRNLIIKLGLNDEQVANIAGVSIEFVQEVRAGISVG